MASPADFLPGIFSLPVYLMNKITLPEPLSETPLLEMRGISKSFPGVKALNDVNISLFPGRVTALIGENGAGK